MRTPLLTLVFAVLASLATPASGRVLLSQQDALASAFGGGASIERQPLYLTDAEIADATRRAGSKVDGGLVVRYAATRGGRLVGWAYFDSHRVRTLPETIMVVVLPDGTIDRIEILAFNEPMDYFPKKRWIEQLDGRRLDDELSLKRSVRPMSGATLTGRAIVDASRRILAIHEIVAARKGGRHQ